MFRKALAIVLMSGMVVSSYAAPLSKENATLQFLEVDVETDGVSHRSLGLHIQAKESSHMVLTLIHDTEGIVYKKEVDASRLDENLDEQIIRAGSYTLLVESQDEVLRRYIDIK